MSGLKFSPFRWLRIHLVKLSLDRSDMTIRPSALFTDVFAVITLTFDFSNDCFRKCLRIFSHRIVVRV